MSILFLQKESNEKISKCKCVNSLAVPAGQLDCPWCGCGWLFTCIECNLAFTFAKAVKINNTWNNIAEKILVSKGLNFGGEMEIDEIEEYANTLKEQYKNIELGKSYVYFDGAILDKSLKNFKLNGIHSLHPIFREVPHLSINSSKEHLLNDYQYWSDTKR